MTDSPSKPFVADTAIPLTRDQIIAEGVIRLRQKHKQDVESHREAFDKKAEQKWVEHLAKQKADWIARYKQDNYLPLGDPWKDLSKEDLYRISLPYDTRIEKLAAIELYDQMLYVFLARAPKRTATVEQIQGWFAPYMSVTGDVSVTEEMQTGGARHTITHASGLSKPLADLLSRTWLVRCRFGKVTWVPGEEFDPSEY